MIGRRVLVVCTTIFLAVCCGRGVARGSGAGAATQAAPVDTVRYRETFPVQAPDVSEWVVSLNGTWQFAPEDTGEFAPVAVPGFWGASLQAKKQGGAAAAKWKSGTYRREFAVPAEKPGAIVEFGMLRWGGEVLVNGRSAGSYDLGHSAVQFNLADLVQAGANRLDVKCRGWAALERHEGDIQIPIGAGNWFGIKDGGLPDDVNLYLYNGAWIGPVAVTHKIAGMVCRVGTRVGAGSAGWKGRVAAQIVTMDGKTALSAVRRQPVEVEPNAIVDVTVQGVQAPDARGWLPSSPVLYRMVVWLEGEEGKAVAAAREETFGFRDIKVNDGRVWINGVMVRMFGGTELVMYSMLQLLDDPARLQMVQVDLFKGMNGTAFRSHMNPLPRRWLDVCDRSGILVIPEFPNFPDVQRASGLSPYELPDYWKNLQREIRGILSYRVNHPCIVGWSVSNEGSGFGDWERRFLVPYVKALDPSRLVMLSGDITGEVADQHNFAGMWWGTYGEFLRSVNDLARFYPERIRGCSEYGQYGVSKRWYGPRAITGESPEFQDDLARILMEQTEVLRRARYELIMPYSYGGNWFGKKAGETGRPADGNAPYQALRNAMAPLGVSFESPRHAMAGASLEVPLWVYSDDIAARGHVEATLYLLDKNPGYDWSGAPDGLKVRASVGYAADVEQGGSHRQNVALNLSAEEGEYYLAASVKKADGPAQAISLKQLRMYGAVPKAERRLNVGVIEKDGRVARWLRSRGHRVVMAYGDVVPDVIVISEGCLYDERIRTWGASMTGRVQAGSRLVVLEQGSWDAPVMQPDVSQMLAGLRAAPQQTSLENLFPGAVLAGALGTDGDWQRLNGLDNVAMRVALVPAERVEAAGSQKAPARLTPEGEPGVGSAPASQPGGWTGLMDGYGLRGEKPGWALASRSYGKGEVLGCQVPLLGRVDPAEAGSFDPVAERLLVFLLEGRVAGPASRPAE